jgi:hypothetical protein
MWFSLLILTVTPAQAASLQLSWNAPTTDADGAPLTSLAGYKVYSGQSPGNYTDTLDVGNVLQISIGGLQDGQRYYFAVTAYNIARCRSCWSSPDRDRLGDYYRRVPIRRAWSCSVNRLKPRAGLRCGLCHSQPIGIDVRPDEEPVLLVQA